MLRGFSATGLLFSLHQAHELFTAHFPGEEFLPRAPDPEEIIFFDEPTAEGAQTTGEGAHTTGEVSGEKVQQDDQKEMGAGAEAEANDEAGTEAVAGAEAEKSAEGEPAVTSEGETSPEAAAGTLTETADGC